MRISDFQGVSFEKTAGFPGGHPISHPGFPGGHPISHPGFPGGYIASWKSRGSLKKACGIPGGLCKKVAEFQGVLSKIRLSRGSQQLVDSTGSFIKKSISSTGGCGHFQEKPINVIILDILISM